MDTTRSKCRSWVGQFPRSRADLAERFEHPPFLCAQFRNSGKCRRPRPRAPAHSHANRAAESLAGADIEHAHAGLELVCGNHQMRRRPRRLAAIIYVAAIAGLAAAVPIIVIVLHRPFRRRRPCRGEKKKKKRATRGTWAKATRAREGATWATRGQRSGQRGHALRRAPHSHAWRICGFRLTNSRDRPSLLPWGPGPGPRTRFRRQSRPGSLASAFSICCSRQRISHAPASANERRAAPTGRKSFRMIQLHLMR